jgi:23S rRNA (uridine2552-2'-O)-methyltransferase
MARRPSSQRWLTEHHTDEYVKRARELGYRSRAVFKLKEIDERYRLLRPGLTVIDLGASPGGWSQFARERLGRKGRIIALDLLPMEDCPGVEFICGDFREDSVLEQLTACLAESVPDLVLSDMAPNMSGMRAVDVLRALHLSELALELAQRVLRSGGALVAKTFTGSGFDDFVRAARRDFAHVSVFKPKASRSRSAETYLVATGFRASAR